MKDLYDLYQKGYRVRMAGGRWTLFHGAAFYSRIVGSGKISHEQLALKDAIGMACADWVKRRVQ